MNKYGGDGKKSDKNYIKQLLQIIQTEYSVVWKKSCLFFAKIFSTSGPCPARGMKKTTPVAT
ncbi:MAG: hypothetical protein KJ630_04065 [Proteobacteria bacterium]|nr:hypothetical protein [Pseudomonadota bacterium]